MDQYEDETSAKQTDSRAETRWSVLRRPQSDTEDSPRLHGLFTDVAH
ncbi:hypothetical protein JOF53_002624 [Crossiella equi]|uniref:Uncharacterized protein n=1 Tax=Crossiella equi TaxID=130796 RepID=A0ABS5AAY9_9PSEU|nr:hypothetical protein [Crossiella equi]MBP2473752.1 hypothetical protein [Crossiella equi]